jgi:hypothetical protein
MSTIDEPDETAARQALKCSGTHPFRMPDVPCEERAGYACDECQQLLCALHLMVGPDPRHADLCTLCWAKAHAASVAAMMNHGGMPSEQRTPGRDQLLTWARASLRRLGSTIASWRHALWSRRDQDSNAR